MNFQFKIGAFLGSILLVQLELLTALLTIIFIGSIGEWINFPFLQSFAVVVGIAMILIFVVGHIKTSVAMMRDFTDPTVVEKSPDYPNSFKDLLDISGNPITKGVIWRFKREIVFIKEIANLNFKYKD